MAEIYWGAVKKAEADTPGISLGEVHNKIQDVVDKVVDSEIPWQDSTDSHSDRDVTLNIPMSGGCRQGNGISFSFNLAEM